MSKFCMNCGNELPDIAKFCPKCGQAATSDPPASAPVRPPVCPRCGKQTAPGYEHCVYCGTYWNESAPVKAEPAEKSTAWNTILQESAPQSGYTSRSKTKQPVWLFVLMGLVLCGVVAALIYYPIGGKHLNDTEQSLVGTWDAYYMIVGDESTGVGDGEMRLDLSKKGSFVISTTGDSATGNWSCSNSRTLALDYGGGNVVKMSVEFISDREICTRAKDEDILISWRKR